MGRRGARRQVPGESSHTGGTRDFKAKRPSALMHPLLPPLTRSPCLPPSTLRLEDRPFIPGWRAAPRLARPTRCMAFGVLPALRSLCSITGFSISPNSSVNGACSAANTKSRGDPFSVNLLEAQGCLRAARGGRLRGDRQGHGFLGVPVDG